MGIRNALLAAALAQTPISAHADDTLRADTDIVFEAVAEAVTDAKMVRVIEIDHARLAAGEGVEMPPSRVLLFSDPGVNAAILSENIRAGLDLPFRVLSYGDEAKPSLSYTSSAFIAKRHGLEGSAALADFDERLQTVLRAVDGADPSPVPTDAVERDFGIIEIASAYDVAETVVRLEKAVTAQTDTIWFGEIDFMKEAAAFDVALPAAKLLLFGGPAPGGVAMADYPAIGLDAFCQKLLVYEGTSGNAVVLFNDIAAFAQLYYGSSIEPHAMLNKRLSATFSAAVQ